MCGADLVQRRQVPGQVRPKVLGGFREVGDILQAQWAILMEQKEAANNVMESQSVFELTPNSSRNMIILCLLFLMKGFTPSI